MERDTTYPGEKIRSIVENKWIKRILSNGKSSTIKFAYKEEEPPAMYEGTTEEELTVRGTIVDNLHSHFMPRQYTIETGNQEYDIGTYYWLFFRAAETDESAEVKGTLCDDGETILLNRPSHYIVPSEV